MGRMPGRSSSGTLKCGLFLLSGNNERGILLVDLLLALALALLIIAILQPAAGLVFNGYMNSSNQAELQYSSRSALDFIQQDIRTARNFQVSEDGSQLIITGAGGKNILIFARNGNLYRKYKSTVPVAENISAVDFIKSGSTLQGKLKLYSEDTDYEVDFFCFSRVLKAQE
jgi:type II secretory pathway pseudopilin PulG